MADKGLWNNPYDNPDPSEEFGYSSSFGDLMFGSTGIWGECYSWAESLAPYVNRLNALHGSSLSSSENLAVLSMIARLESVVVSNSFAKVWQYLIIGGDSLSFSEVQGHITHSSLGLISAPRIELYSQALVHTNYK